MSASDRLPSRAPAARRPRWSYRLKVPLALSAVALAAGVAVASTTYLLVYRFVEANAVAQTQRLARTLARSLVQPVLSNDVWQAFRTVRASSPTPAAQDGSAPQIVVIDAQGEVFVALDPQAYPVGSSAVRLPAPLAAAARWIGNGGLGQSGYVEEDAATNSLVVAERLIGEEGRGAGRRRDRAAGTRHYARAGA